MNNVLRIAAAVSLAGCMSSNKFDERYEQRFCDEWEACSPDFECDLPEFDHSECAFDRAAAKECLEGEWVCDQSNAAFPLVLQPEACSRAYVQCLTETGTVDTTPITTTDSGS